MIKMTRDDNYIRFTIVIVSSFLNLRNIVGERVLKCHFFEFKEARRIPVIRGFQVVGPERLELSTTPL